MSADIFLDTNILIYAYDSQAGSKHLVARDILRSFWDSLIICAAVKGDANTILTEYLSHDQCIEGVRIQNPLLSTQ
jgi:predicted nucleic acid-binding protein